ncbi:MAG: hypothetical protein HYY34_06665 [Chloroflexi bacterium]|nr:hypothetical protein [Chloroflexota bacterium]
MVSLLSTLRRRTFATVTIELGLVKVLVCRDLEVLGYRITPVTPRYFREGLISNREGVAGVIRSAVSDLDGQTSVAVAAVPGFQNNLWVMELPQAQGLDPGLVIPQDATRRMGISPETSYMRWHRLADILDRRRWLVVSATRRSMATIPETFQRSGLKLRYMELRQFALARAVNEPDAMIVSTYADGCDVVIVRDAAPVANTGLYWGADTLDGPTLLNRLAEAASRTVAVHNQNTLEDPLSEDVPLFVFGSPIAREPTIATQLATALQRPSGVASPPIRYPADLPLQDMMVNIGLALAMG